MLPAIRISNTWQDFHQPAKLSRPRRYEDGLLVFSTMHVSAAPGGLRAKSESRSHAKKHRACCSEFQKPGVYAVSLFLDPCTADPACLSNCSEQTGSAHWFKQVRDPANAGNKHRCNTLTETVHSRSQYREMKVNSSAGKHIHRGMYRDTFWPSGCLCMHLYASQRWRAMRSMRRWPLARAPIARFQAKI